MSAILSRDTLNEQALATFRRMDEKRAAQDKTAEVEAA